MTTVATDGRSMAGDGQTLSANDIILCRNSPKVLRLDDGSLLGCSGNADVKYKLRGWIEAGCVGPFPELKTAFAAMWLIRPNEGRYFSENTQADFIEMEFPFAIGSGSEVALGAMEAGLSPLEAVTIAAKRDPFTGGKIVALDLPE